MGYINKKTATKKELKSEMKRLADELEMSYPELRDLIYLVTGKRRIRDLTRAEVLRVIKTLENIKKAEEKYPGKALFVTVAGTVYPIKGKSLDETISELKRLL